MRKSPIISLILIWLALPLCAGTRIIAFEVPGQLEPAVIGVGRVDVALPAGANPKVLVPFIVTDGDSCRLLWDKASEEQGCPHYYKVYDRGNAATQEWEVYFTFHSEASSPCVAAVHIEGQQGATFQVADTFVVVMPAGTDLTALNPQFTFSIPTAVLAPTGVQDFSRGMVAYTITDSVLGSVVSTLWLRVSLAAPQECEATILYFSILGVQAIWESDTMLVVHLAPTVNVAELAPVITLAEGATLSPSAGSIQDFTHPVVYTVVGACGLTNRYTVCVRLRQSTGLLHRLPVLLDVFPNPAQGKLCVDAGGHVVTRASLYTLYGARCKVWTTPVGCLALPKLKPGLYLLVLILQDGQRHAVRVYVAQP